MQLNLAAHSQILKDCKKSWMPSTKILCTLHGPFNQVELHISSCASIWWLMRSRINGKSCFELRKANNSTLSSPNQNSLNSRPMCVNTNDPKDGETLTPVLCDTKLETFLNIKTPKISDLSNCTATTRWVHIQNVLLAFWKLWNKKFVTSSRGKKEWSKSH